MNSSLITRAEAAHKTEGSDSFPYREQTWLSGHNSYCKHWSSNTGIFEMKNQLTTPELQFTLNYTLKSASNVANNYDSNSWVTWCTKLRKMHT